MPRARPLSHNNPIGYLRPGEKELKTLAFAVEDVSGEICKGPEVRHYNILLDENNNEPDDKSGEEAIDFDAVQQADCSFGSREASKLKDGKRNGKMVCEADGQPTTKKAK